MWWGPAKDTQPTYDHQNFLPNSGHRSHSFSVSFIEINHTWVGLAVARKVGLIGTAERSHPLDANFALDPASDASTPGS